MFGSFSFCTTSITNTWVSRLALSILLLTASSWAEEEQPSLIFERLHITSSPDSPSGQSMLALRPTFFTPPLTIGRLKDAVPDSEGLRSKGMQGSHNWLDGKLKAESELAIPDGTELDAGTQYESGRRMIRLSLTGMEGAFRYGALSRTAGKAYVEGANQSSREVWGEYVYGLTRFRSAVGQTWDNVDGDPSQPRLLQTYGRLGMSLVRPHWPELSLTYTRASLLNAFISGGMPMQRAATDGLEATLSYMRPTWNVWLASSSTMTDNQLPGTRDTTGLAESFTTSYRPWNSLTITPSLGLPGSFRPVVRSPPGNANGLDLP